MSLIARCPHCDSRFRVREELAGKRARCRKCRETFTIDEASEEVVVLQPAESGEPAVSEDQHDDAPRLEDYFPADEDPDEVMATEAALPDIDADEDFQLKSPVDAGAATITSEPAAQAAPQMDAPFPVPPVAPSQEFAQPAPHQAMPSPHPGPAYGYPPAEGAFPTPGAVTPPPPVAAPPGAFPAAAPVATLAGPGTAADVALHAPKLLHAAQWGLVWAAAMGVALLLGQYVHVLVGIGLAVFATWTCYVGMISCVSYLAARQCETGVCPPQGQAWTFFVRNAVGLVFGTAALGAAVALAFAIVFGGIAMISQVETLGPIVGGLLVIPTFLLILIAASVTLNMYLLPVVIGVDDRGLLAAFRMICQLAVRQGFAMMYRYLQAILSILPQLLISTVLTVGAAAGAVVLCGGAGAAQAAMSDTPTVGAFLQAGSLLLITAAWMSFVVVFVTVSFTLVYHSSTERRIASG
ncbi:hypothetical protein Mal4_53620 [Maioricimonas rarisocia]|uniref:Zinc finger/thioredoxin putative domain-containing protein n=1 Tax=Maioricimonas rarisocia TaxID=2528026 RepID=A0A517ZEU4_9PLAN|nr:zinc-ribbon domain-containing protein [Maioricimonas rarisocia]QDU40997.1 hypothetical protein Mal4_53620 [Maioricimonas rarisocia]